MIYNPDFKVTIIQRQVTRKWYNIELCLQWRTNRKLYMNYRMAPLLMILNDPYPRFQGHGSFDAKYLRNRTRYIQWNTKLTHAYSAVLFQMTLSDLAKYSVTRRVAQYLCNS